MQDSTLRQLKHDNPSVVLRTLAAIRDCPCSRFPGLGAEITRLQTDSDPGLRRAAVASANQLGDGERDACLLRALQDGHASVRQAAVDAIQTTGIDLVTEVTRWIGVDNRGNPRAQQALLQAGIRAGMPASRLKQLAVDKSHEAHRLRAARRQLLAENGDLGTDMHLLSCMLEERYRATMNLALLGLEPLHEPGRIGVIRAGISRRDERFVAGACEALNTLQNEPAAQLLSRLLQDSKQDTGRDALFAGADDALQWYRGWAGELAIPPGWNGQTQHAVEETGTMSTLNDRILLLKKSSLFSEVSTDDLRFVADALVESEYFPGQRVFDIGERGDHLYLIVEGRIGISLSPDPEAREFVATIGAGEHFGEMNLLDDLPRSATAHVLEETRLLSLEKGRLRGLILSYPEISLGIMRGLSMVVRECHQRAADKT